MISSKERGRVVVCRGEEPVPPLSPIAVDRTVPQVLAELVAELGPRWQARQDARLTDRPRQRAVGAGARHRLVFIHRLMATLVHLRH